MKSKRVWAVVLGALAVLLALFLRLRFPASLRPPSFFDASPGAHAAAFPISSSSFSNGGRIPKRFTCDGGELSPELSWGQAPAGTQSLAIIADDPDAPIGIFTHWVIFNLPPGTNWLPEGVSRTSELENGSRQGLNDFGNIGYAGPCPPLGTHRYFFKLYALDRKLDLKAGSSKPELETAIEGHVLRKADWVGTYRR